MNAVIPFGREVNVFHIYGEWEEHISTTIWLIQKLMWPRIELMQIRNVEMLVENSEAFKHKFHSDYTYTNE